VARWRRADHLDRWSVVALKELEELPRDRPLQAAPDAEA
jgi:hypothetical protein